MGFFGLTRCPCDGGLNRSGFSSSRGFGGATVDALRVIGNNLCCSCRECIAKLDVRGMPLMTGIVLDAVVSCE